MIDQKLIDRAEAARLKLNTIPWWRPIKRQDAGRVYRYALLAAAYAELDMMPPEELANQHIRQVP